MGTDTVAPPPAGFDTDVTPQNAGVTVPPPPPGFDQDVTGSQKPSGWDTANLHQKLQIGWDALKYVSSQTPWAKIQQGLKTAGGDIAEGGGYLGGKLASAGYPDAGNAVQKTGVGVGGAVALAPQLLASYASLPQGVQSMLSNAPGEAGQFIGQKLASEAGSVGGDLPTPPPESTPPATPPPPATPNYLQQTGGAGLNSQMGIRGSTILKMTPKGQNPGAVGINLAKQLQEQGVSATNPIDAWDSINKLTQEAGANVGTAKQAIAQEATKYGAVDNPLEIDTEKALKPLYEAWKSHANNITGVGKDVADYLGGVHQRLSQVGEASGGTINLDHIDQALSEVGPLTHSGSLENQAMNQELYGRLADTRDAMVKTIADQAKNPSLAQNLINANKQYSQFVRVLPDVARASANSATGQKNLAGIFQDLQHNLINRGGLSAGGAVPNASQLQTGAQLAAKPILGKLGEKIEGQENP